MVKVKSVKKHEKKETETTDVQKPALVIKKPKKPPDYLENGLLVGEAQNGSGSGVEETPDEPMNGPVDLAKPMDLTHAAEEPMHIDPKPSVSPVPLPNNAESPPTEAPPTSGTTPPEPSPSPPGQNGGLSRSPRSDPLPVLDTNGDISHESRDDSRDAESRDRPESRDMSRSESHDMSRSESQDSCSQEVEGAPLWNNSLSSLEQLLNQAPTHQQQELQKAGHFPPAFRGPRIPTASGFICDKCGFVSKSQAGVNKHKGRVHSDKNEKFVAAHPYKCNICEFRAKRVKQVREHVAVHGVQCCMYCLFAGTRDEIERHVLADHASRPVKTCHVCSKSMDMDDHQYQEHVTSCDGHKLIFQCELCPRAFNFKNDLKLHEQSHETEKVKRFACDDCDYQTAYRANLMKHIEHKHQTVKPKLTCPICQKLYHNDMALKRHVKTHSEKPGHVCDQCEKVFEGVRGLKEHLREVHNCYMYKCEVVGCDKTFKSRKAVRNHCAEFHGMADKKYRCDYEGCTMEFFRSSHLSRHKRTHSGSLISDEREFKCTWPECGKAFRHADNLKVHYRKHTNDKCFKCPECEYTCTQKHVLNGHVRRHHQPGSTESFIGDYEYADSEEDTDETLILADVLDSSFNDSTLMQFAEEFMSHWDNEKIDRHYPGLEEVFDNLDTIDLDSFVWEAEEIDETLAILTLDGIRKRKRGRPRLEEIGAVSATVRRKRSQNKDWSEDQPRQKRQQKRFLDPDRLRSEPRKQDPSVYDFNSDDEGNHLMQHQHHQQQQQQQHMYNQQQQQNMMMHHYNNYNNTMSGGKMQHMMPHQQQPPPNQAMGGMEQMNAQLSEQMNSQMPDQMAQHGKLLSQALTRPLDQMSNMAMQPMPGYSGPVSEPQDIASNIPPIMPEVQTSCPSSLPDAGGMFDPGHATSDLFGEHKPEKNEIIDQHLLQKYLEDTSMEDFERDLIKNEKPNKTGEFDQYMGTEAPAPIEAPGSISSGGHSADHWKNHDPKSNDISSVHSWSDKQEHTDTPVHYDQSIIPQSPMVSKPSDYQPPSVQSDHQPSDYNPNLPTYDHGGIPTLPTYSGPDSRPDNREPVFGQSTNYHTPTPPICSSANDSAAYNNPLQLAPTSRPLENPLSSLAMSTAKYLESEMSKTRVYSNQGWTLQETQSLRLTHSLLGRGQEWPPTPDSGTSYPYLSDRDPYSASTANRVPPYFPGELEKPCPGSDYDRYDMARYLNPGLPSQPPGFNPYDRLGASKPYEPGFRQPMDYRQALPTPPDIYATMADKYSFYSRPDPYSPRVADNPFLAGQPVQPGFPAGRDYARDYREYPRAPVYPQPGGYPTLMESAAKYPEPGPDFFMPGRPAPPVQDPYRPMVYNMMNRYYQ